MTPICVMSSHKHLYRGFKIANRHPKRETWQV